MKVFQLVYTKVSKEESPWKKMDFHTVFYPVDLISQTELIELEKKIHFPGSGEFKEKETVFYQKIQGRVYLVILYMQNLPEARDTFGRTGIFLCHGFLFPEEMWRKVPTPLALFELVKEKLFRSREDLLSSSLVNRNTGNIQALDITQERLNALSDRLPGLSTEIEWVMAILLNRIASTTEERPSILFKGESGGISSLMNKLFAYIPDDLKLNLGWDSCLDNGSLTFYPLKIVGFKDKPPRGGNPIRIEMKPLTIEETPEILKFFLPQTPYEKWLIHCRNEAVNKEQIERAYRLSVGIETKTLPPVEEVLFQRACFASVNKEVIESFFLKRCEETLGTTIANYLVHLFTPDSMLELLIENLPPVKLVSNVEDVILKNRLTLKDIEKPFPSSFIETGSLRLRLIERLWRKEVISPDDLRPLRGEERFGFVVYLLLSWRMEKDWIVEILRDDEEIFRRLLSSYEIKGVIEKVLREIILKEKDFREIGEFLFKEILRQKQGFALLKREVNFMDVLEEFLREGIWDNKEIKELISWAKKRSHLKKDSPYTRAFLYPKQGIPEEVLRDNMARKRLIEYLIQHHGYKDKDFEGFGLGKEEQLNIKKQMKGKEWMERVKGLFGFKGL